MQKVFVTNSGVQEFTDTICQIRAYVYVYVHMWNYFETVKHGMMLGSEQSSIVLNDFTSFQKDDSRQGHTAYGVCKTFQSHPETKADIRWVERMGNWDWFPDDLISRGPLRMRGTSDHIRQCVERRRVSRLGTVVLSTWQHLIGKRHAWWAPHVGPDTAHPQSAAPSCKMTGR